MEEYTKKVESLVTLKTVDAKYQIKDDKLGEGSFASTYLCFDSKNRNVTACKMISKLNLINKINKSKNKTLTKQYFINALKTQVNTWKNLHHQNVVEFIDFSETQNNIYFFLEFCPGGNLENILKKRGAIPLKQALPMMYQIASGCTYLYNLGIFHRDLKPENILIGKQGRIKISDFGFAKAIENQQQKNKLSQGTSVGTPIYMSPQVLLQQPYTIKCDVWSIGVVFYKILVGIIPWQQTDNLAVLVQKMKQPILIPPNLQIDDWLRKMVINMLAVEQSNRLCIIDVKKILGGKLGIMDEE